MKKKIALFITTVFAVAALPVAAFAEGGQSIVAGTVTNSGTGNPVGGASVSVLCDGHTLTSSTTSAGAYVVQFPSADCPNGATAQVTATKGSNSASNSGKVNKLSASVNLAIVNVSVVPEFGIVAGISAAILGGGAFIVMRQRQLNQS